MDMSKLSPYGPSGPGANPMTKKTVTDIPVQIGNIAPEPTLSTAEEIEAAYAKAQTPEDIAVIDAAYFALTGRTDPASKRKGI